MMRHDFLAFPFRNVYKGAIPAVVYEQVEGSQRLNSEIFNQSIYSNNLINYFY